MLKWGSFLIICAIAWYTMNVARVAWRSGNKTGAAMVAVVAFIALAFPSGMLFLR